MKRTMLAVVVALSFVGAECKTQPVTPHPVIGDAGPCVSECDCACAALVALGCVEGKVGRVKCMAACDADHAFWRETPTPERALPARCVAASTTVDAARACGTVCR